MVFIKYFFFILNIFACKTTKKPKTYNLLVSLNTCQKKNFFFFFTVIFHLFCYLFA